MGSSGACCAGLCAFTGGDTVNCGACGNVCPSGPNAAPTCNAGVCGLSCGPMFTDCDRNPANGCEANVSSDPANCGACGLVCPAGQTCPLGRCGTVTLKVALTWSVAADMDLHVVTPGGFEIFHGLRSADGGTLDVDVTNGTGPENVLWTAAPPTGTYLVCAVPYAIPGPTAFTVEVSNGGAALMTWTGTHAASDTTGTCSRASPSFVGEFTL